MERDYLDSLELLIEQAKQVNYLISQKTRLESLKKLFMGEHLGHGANRQTSILTFNEEFVVKFAKHEAGALNNVKEYQLWEAIKDFPLGGWLAPCVAISSDSYFLIQKKIEFRSMAEYVRYEFVPACFRDVSCSNFGWLGDQLVCCDYGDIYLDDTIKNVEDGCMQRALWRL